eukprot:Rmarinus@m.6409
MLFSTEERRFVVEGVEENLRADGRNRLEYGCITIETGAAEQASGSARVQLRGTNVVVGIKVDIADPAPSLPDAGRLEFTVEWSGLAGASPDADCDIAGAVLAGMYRDPNVFDLKKYCILPGKQCWVFYVDAVVLESDGNLIDAISIAVKAAFHDLVLPCATVETLDGGSVEVSIDDDPENVQAIDTSSLPLVVSLSQVGTKFIIDATRIEESCREGALHVAVTPKGQICAVQQAGPGWLNATSIKPMLSAAQKTSQALFKSIDTHLRERALV